MLVTHMVKLRKSCEDMFILITVNTVKVIFKNKNKILISCFPKQESANGLLHFCLNKINQTVSCIFVLNLFVNTKRLLLKYREIKGKHFGYSMCVFFAEIHLSRLMFFTFFHVDGVIVQDPNSSMFYIQRYK